jgi:sugar O-acyltransferase (sialic acid O-acetyltransferase NeuD family)
METDKLIVLGMSAPTLAMILDNLESCRRFPDIHVVNNLELSCSTPFRNPLFRVAVVNSYEDEDFRSDAFLGVNKPSSKHIVVELFRGRGLTFTNIVNRSSAISSTAQLGHGVHVNSMVSIAAFAAIGNFVSINRNASIGHHSVVGDFSTINPGANIAGFVRIGENTHIGMGANVADGLDIGAGTIIGAGSLVTKDIPSGVVAYGNPCRVVRANET